MEGDYDYLQLKGQDFVSRIVKEGEKIYFSAIVHKKNHFGWSQNRTMLITDIALYNINKTEVKRRIELQHLSGISVTTKSNEFVIHCNDYEYDYHYTSSKKRQIAEVLATLYRDKLGKEFNIFLSEKSSLKDVVTTKKEKRKNFSSTKVGTLKAISIEDYLAIESNGGTPVLNTEGAVTAPNYYNESMTIKDFDLKKLIGRGNFSKVYLAEHNANKELYAIKSIRKDQIVSQRLLRSTHLEKEILSSGGCPFIIALNYYFISSSHIYFAMPYLNGGDMYTYLERLFQNSKKLSEKDVSFCGAQIAIALEYLHVNNIIYRDLKLENILIDKDGYIKLCDFGSAIYCADGSTSPNYSYAGSLEYMSPEMIIGNGHCKATDWWSFGVLLYELYYGVTPFANENQTKMSEYIQWAEVKFPSDVPITSEFMDLIKQLLTKEPNKRLGNKGISDIKSHPFFKDINFDDFKRKHKKSPFKFKVNQNDDTSNFDEYFTSKSAEDSQVDDWVGNYEAIFNNFTN